MDTSIRGLNVSSRLRSRLSTGNLTQVFVDATGIFTLYKSDGCNLPPWWSSHVHNHRHHLLLTLPRSDDHCAKEEELLPRSRRRALMVSLSLRRPPMQP
jgi:hypothetical protein